MPNICSKRREYLEIIATFWLTYCPPKAMISMGMLTPSEYINSKIAAANKSFCKAINVKMDANTGPAQGVHTKPKVMPSNNALKFPLVPRPTLTLILEMILVNFTAINSKGFDQIKRIPKKAKIKIPTVRTILALNPRYFARSDKMMAANVKTMTNPKTIKTGRSLFFWPKEVPSNTGNSGRVQGAATVNNPAKKANIICSMFSSYQKTALMAIFVFSISVSGRAESNRHLVLGKDV